MNRLQIIQLTEFLINSNFKFLINSSLTPYLSFRIGDRSQFIIEIKESELLIELLNFFSRNAINFIILGGGTNTVFTSSLFKGVVIINKTTRIKIRSQNSITVDSGVRNQDLLTFCIKNELGGLEFLSGLPGTIGGAAAVNAGAFGFSLQDIVLSARVFNSTLDPEKVNNDYFNFSYRYSRFKFGKEVILSLDLEYQPSKKDLIKKRIKDNLNYRLNNHPSYKENTAGCFFKNPIHNNEKISAGKLIQSLHLNNQSHRSLKISNKHANFIINHNSARFNELEEFVHSIKKRVIKEYGILLEREIIYISQTGEKS
jgi:UDP-N-acetylmuramate dehydrogenase